MTSIRCKGPLLGAAVLWLGGCAFTVSLGALDATPAAIPDTGNTDPIDAALPPMDRTPGVDATNAPDQPATPDQPARPDRPGMPDRPETPDRPDGPELVDVTGGDATPDPACRVTGVEQCNGLDDDCDGRVDNLFPAACQSAPCAVSVLACRAGIVAGRSEDPICHPVGFLPTGTVCRPPTNPCDLGEVCSGADFECPANRQAPFGTVCRPASACAGNGICDDGGGGRQVCEPSRLLPPGTACGSGLRCNGIGECSPCEVGWTMCGGRCREIFACRAVVGECSTAAGLRCQPGGVLACTSEQLCTPTSERCDGYDNDSDGLTDEGTCRIAERCYPDGAVNPANPCQVCNAPATAAGPTAWSNRTAGTACRPTAGICDVAETCDGGGNCPADRFVPGGSPCRPDAGSCRPAAICSGTSAACPADAIDGPPPTEACDGVDNDCDGLVDEGFCRIDGRCVSDGTPNPANACQACVASATSATPSTTWSNVAAGAVCRPSVIATACDPEERCAGDGSPCPVNEVLRRPVPELCDGVDNDCNGLVDEGLSRRCYDGPPGTASVGRCRAGTQTCAAGAWGACAGQVLPAGETCNGVDDDCDNLFDDGCR